MTAAELTVRVVARALPAPIRSRHREEWLADIAGASEHGLNPASVAVGATIFAITLDRDLPSVSGFPVAEQSRRHARWALIFAGIAALWGLGRNLIDETGVSAVPIAVVFVLGAVIQLWAAARLSSGLGRTAAVLGTAGLAIFGAAATIPIVVSDAVPGSRHLLTVSTGLLAGAVVLGIIVWVRGVGPWIIACLATITGAFSLIVAPVAFNALALASGVVVVGIVLQARLGSTLSESRAASRRARTVTVVSSAVLLALLALTAVDTLVLTPLRLARDGRSLESVYSSLPDSETAVGHVVVWIIVSTVAVLCYLVLGLRFAPRWGVRHSALLGIALGAALLMSVDVASFSLVSQLVDSFVVPGYSYPEPRVGLYLQLVALALLAVGAVGWLAPREAPETAPDHGLGSPSAERG